MTEPAAARRKACDACRARKVRCDGRRPTCTPCSTSNKTCEYLPRVRSPTSVLALGARASFLEERLNALLANQSEAKEHFEGPSALGLSFGEDESAPPSPVRLSDAWEIQDNEREYLLETFFREKHRCFSHVDEMQFKASLSSKDLTQRPHPALLNAILLVGLSFAQERSHATGAQQPVPSHHAETLLAETQKSMNDSLAVVDRLLDYIQAASLLSFWFVRKGRLIEAQYISSATARFAINCRLHRIDNLMFQEMLEDGPASTSRPSLWDSSLLGRPVSLNELGLRISTFWEIYLHDKIMSLSIGLPSGFAGTSEARITTLWPVCGNLDTYRNTLRSQPLPSIDHLGPEAGNKTSSGVVDTLFTSALKSITFLDYASRFCTTNYGTSHDSTDTFQSLKTLELALQAHDASLAPLSDPPVHTPDPAKAIELAHHQSINGFSHLVTIVASILLYRAKDSPSPVVESGDQETSGRQEAAATKTAQPRTPQDKELSDLRLSAANSAMEILRQFIEPPASMPVEANRRGDDDAFLDEELTHPKSICTVFGHLAVLFEFLLEKVASVFLDELDQEGADEPFESEPSASGRGHHKSAIRANLHDLLLYMVLLARRFPQLENSMIEAIEEGLEKRGLEDA